jgi:SulP family sulfate permease
MLVPKLFTTLRGYDRTQFLRDLSAGVIVGIVALPLAIAFAIASGVSPEKGLITAIVAGFVISALGGSRVQIGGPTGAFVVVIYGVVEKFGIDGLIVVTFLAGVVLVLMGLARFGAVIKFIPAPVITGFTSGIAVIIFSSEVKDFLGLNMGAVPADFYEKWAAFLGHLSAVNPYAIGIAVFTLAVLIWWPRQPWLPRISTKIPAPFVALIATTIAVRLLDLPVETIGSRFGDIPSTFPTPHWPHITFPMLKMLMPSVFTVAILGAVESLLSAVVSDGMIGGKHRSNMELVAQGAANMLSPLFGGIPATGAIARTATNVKSGGRTPVAGMVHALTLLVIMLAVGQWASMIPMATLAAILVIVAYNMSEWRTFKGMLRAPKSDIIVLLATFLLTVVIDLTVAIEVGMVLASFLFMYRMAMVTNVSAVTSEIEDGTDPDLPSELSGKKLPKGVQVYEINGPFFFGAAEKFTETIGAVGAFPTTLVIRMRNVPAIDATGIKALRDMARHTKRAHSRLVIAEIHSQPLVALQASGLFDEIGEQNFAIDLQGAIALHSPPPLAT